MVHHILLVVGILVGIPVVLVVLSSVFAVFLPPVLSFGLYFVEDSSLLIFYLELLRWYLILVLLLVVVGLFIVPLI